MHYFVTGGTGFIGRNLVADLVKRGGTVHLLLRGEHAQQKLAGLQRQTRAAEGQLLPVYGDLCQPFLGLDSGTLTELKGQIDHFFHLAAIYDLNATPEQLEQANSDGTRHAVETANAIQAGCFHHTSSIAVAGLYRGVFREDMFEEAEQLDHPYFSSKHLAEKTVRESCRVPWRIYRPGMVVGHSQTGEADRIDGPYYFFKLLQKLRDTLPRWMPTIGLEGGRLNIVPVDYVVKAMAHIAHQPDLDQGCFHLTDPRPYRAGKVLNIFADAGHAPRTALRLDASLLNLIPAYMRDILMKFPPLRHIGNNLLCELGIPAQATHFFNYPTEFDCRETEAALKHSDISCPRLESYAPAVWDFWERHLDPSLNTGRSLNSVTRGKRILITGATSGIGHAIAMKLGRTQATLILIARSEENLEETRQQIEAMGGTAHTYASDLSDLAMSDQLIQRICKDHGGVDILINNAGRSIRRAIANSLDRFHDLQRTMQLNYFGAAKLITGFMPAMLEQKRGHIINISSIGVLTNSPRFSAYVASKSALDAYARCASAEFSNQNIHFTTINMPLVKTPMIAPTQLYRSVPTLSPEEAADLVVKAILHKPLRVATRLGVFGALIHTAFPRLGEVIMNTGFRMFPESDQSKKPASTTDCEPVGTSSEMIAFAAMLRGIHM